MVDSIPRGRVATYGQIAREAGLPRNARLVGRLLANLPDGSRIPWHRVINSAGALSPRPGSSVARQRRLLIREGVPLSSAGRVDLARFRWHPADDEPREPR